MSTLEILRVSYVHLACARKLFVGCRLYRAIWQMRSRNRVTYVIRQTGLAEKYKSELDETKCGLTTFKSEADNMRTFHGPSRTPRIWLLRP